MKAGEHIGGVESNVRTATCMCSGNSDVHLAYLSHHDYGEILRRMFIHEKDGEIRDFRRFGLLAECQQASL